MTTDITTKPRAEHRAVGAHTPRTRTATAPAPLAVAVDQALGVGRETNRLRKRSLLDTILGREY